MSVVSVNNEEIFSVMQSTNLVRIKFKSIDMWSVMPVLYCDVDNVNLLIGTSNFVGESIDENKVLVKFQKQGYEYIINGELIEKNLSSPATITIKYQEAIKYYNLRKSIRFDTNIDGQISYMQINSNEEVELANDVEGNCLVRNISKGGAMFLSKNELNLSDLIWIKLQFPSRNYVVSKAKVLRKIIADDNTFSYGIQFEQIEDQYKCVFDDEIKKLEKEYFNSLNILRDYKNTTSSNYETKIAIFSYDIQGSYEVREWLIKLGAQNFDVISDLRFYHEYVEEEKPKIIIIDALDINEEIIGIIENINYEYPDTCLLTLLPIELREDKRLNDIKKSSDILLRPLIYDEFEGEIIKYL
ncbi:UNVERIFIED_CONTAM: PilZ domain-containing protein [Acetivibrio alkalicellulosi]